jgi:hypothetical protein
MNMLSIIIYNAIRKRKKKKQTISFRQYCGKKSTKILYSKIFICAHFEQIQIEKKIEKQKLVEAPRSKRIVWSQSKLVINARGQKNSEVILYKKIKI